MVLYQNLVISELLCTKLILMYGDMNFVTAIMVCLCASWIGPIFLYLCVICSVFNRSFYALCHQNFLLSGLSVGPISYLWIVNWANSMLWCILFVLSPSYPCNIWFVCFFRHFKCSVMSITLETYTCIWACFEVDRKQPNRHQAERQLLISPTNI